MIRDCEIKTYTDFSVIGASWQGVVEESGDAFSRITGCQFGFAEEVIALLVTYQDNVGYRYQVTIGESLRPTENLYDGDDQQVAEELFWRAVTHHTRDV